MIHSFSKQYSIKPENMKIVDDEANEESQLNPKIRVWRANADVFADAATTYVLYYSSEHSRRVTIC